MPSPEHITPRGYLIRLLAQGNHRFRYRQGVHRLLGIPERPAQTQTFLPVLPPIDFKYEQPSFGVAPPTSVPLGPEGMGAVRYKEKPLQAYPRPTGPQGVPPPPPPVPATVSTPPPGRDEVPAAGAAAPPKQNIGESFDGPAETKHVQLSIPGVTTKHRLASAPLVPGHTLPARPSLQRAGDAPTTDAPPGVDARSKVNAHTPPATPRRTSEDHKKADSVAPAPKSEFVPSPTVSAVRAATERIQPAEAIPPTPQFKPAKRVTDEVEHLRQAVRRLAAKQAPAPASPPEAPPQAPPPAPVPPVVVVEPPPEPVRRTPRAFWSASTLRRTHLRTLR